MTAGRHLLARYFRCRLPTVQSLARVGQFCGHAISPFLLHTLLMHLGFQDTVLTQAGLVLQSLIGVCFFRNLQYQQAQEQTSAYVLLHTEDDAVPKPQPHLLSERLTRSQDTSSFSVPHVPSPPPPTPKTFHESIPGCSGMHTQPSNNSSTQPFYDSMPRPLFSDVELEAVGHDAAFFIEDPTDEDVVMYVYGDHLRRGFRFTEELKIMWRPLFYASLLLVTVTRQANLAFWLLFPSLAMSSGQDMLTSKAAGIVSGLGLIDICLAFTSPFLPTITPARKKYITCFACFLAAGGLYALSVSQSLLWLVCAAVVVRLGVGGVEILSKPMLKEAMGLADYDKAQSLLDILTGLLVLLSALTLKIDYNVSFWLLAWFYVSAGGVWGIQPFLDMCCNKTRH